FKPLWKPDTTGIPKYKRVLNAMMEAIKSGIWEPGSKLPPEDDLAKLTPFSLGTVQRALRALSAQGLITRHHGLGSFVTQRPRRLENPWHCRFLADNNEDIVPIYSKAIKRELMNEYGPWSKHLGSSDTVVQLDRIINVNDEFNVYSRFYAKAELLKIIWELPFEELHGANVKKLIGTRYQLPITEILHQVSVKQFDQYICKKINIGTNSFGLFMQAIARAGTEFTVYYQEFFIPPGKRALRFFENTPAPNQVLE